MENSIISVVSGPFVDRHASETAFARDDLRNSWKLEFCLEIALISTKIRRAGWAELQRLYFTLFFANIERIIWSRKGLSFSGCAAYACASFFHVTRIYYIRYWSFDTLFIFILWL